MRSWCFDSVATTEGGVTTYDREYGSADVREVIKTLVGNGVFADGSDMKVTPSSDLTVQVLPGACVVQGALGVVDTAESLTIPSTFRGNTALIVARYDLNTAYRSIRLAAVSSLSQTASIYDLQLASVAVPASGAITAADITDTRANGNVCGLVAGKIPTIDTSTIFNDLQAGFNTWFAGIQGVITEEAATNLYNMIQNLDKDDIGLGNVLNEAQYCQSNPPHFADYLLPGGRTDTNLVLNLPFDANFVIGMFVAKDRSPWMPREDGIIAGKPFILKKPDAGTSIVSETLVDYGVGVTSQNPYENTSYLMALETGKINIKEYNIPYYSPTGRELTYYLRLIMF